MAIINSNSANRPVDYIQLSFGRNSKAPLGMSIALDQKYTEFKPVEGVGGIIRHVHVRTKPVGNSMMETCTIYFADEGEPRGTALQFATGGPDKYSFAAGHLVAKLLACRPDDEIGILAYVFKAGTTGRRADRTEYTRQDPELAVVVSANGQRIQQANWGVDDQNQPLTRGPDAPFILNPNTGRETDARDYTYARLWMESALHGLQFSFNRRANTEAQHQAQSAPISLDDLPEEYVSNGHAPAAQAPARGYATHQGERG